MFDPLTISASAATALGAYNVARFVVTKAAEKRRKVKEAKNLAGDVRAAIGFAKKAYEAVSDGLDDEERKKIKAFAAAVKEAVQAESEPPAAGPASN